MRNIPIALQNHLNGEVIALTKCLSITKNDGSVVRITTHDQNLTVGGNVYYSTVALNISAIQSTDDLSIDNAEITIGLDGVHVKTDDLVDGLYDNAEFELFAVNWFEVSQGIIPLKRGSLGDIRLNGDISATIQLRGLTHYLQKEIVERYSPTCRVNLGGDKCGVANLPLRIRRDLQKCKTFDWFLVPQVFASVSSPNLSFDTDGSVPNGSSGITGWMYGEGSFWQVTNDYPSVSGGYYLAGGDDSSGPSTGGEFVLYKDLSLSDAGLNEVDVDSGLKSFDLSACISRTSEVFLNSGRVYIEFFDEDGLTLLRTNSAYIIPEYQEWQGIGVTSFVVPRSRTIRIGLQARKDSGNVATVAFDSIKLRTWDNSAATFGGSSFRTMLIPGADNRRSAPIANGSFEQGLVPNGTSGIGGWSYGSGSYWQVVSSSGAVTPYSGSFMLRGGDNGSASPGQEYALYQEYDILAIDANVTDSDLAAGWYVGVFETRVARLNSESSARAVITYLDGSSNILSSFTSELSPTAPGNVWTPLRVGGAAPSGARKVRVTLIAISGSSSDAGVAFDSAESAFTVTAFEGTNDFPYGKLASAPPAYNYATNSYTLDGAVIVQARPLVFAYAEVTEAIDERAFGASAISDTPSRLYSGRVVWLSGENAGRVSFIRIWDDTTKRIKLYDRLRGEIRVGDKFCYTLGCTKTIDVCADTFGNATNFRGEPYLPGPAKVIEFMSNA